MEPMELPFDLDFFNELDSVCDLPQAPSIPPEELSNDVQHQTLWGYPLYRILLRNFKILKKKLKHKSNTINNLKSMNKSLLKEISVTKGALDVAQSDINRLSDNMKLQIDKFETDREMFEAKEASQQLIISQMQYKYRALRDKLSAIKINSKLLETPMNTSGPTQTTSELSELKQMELRKQKLVSKSVQTETINESDLNEHRFVLTKEIEDRVQLPDSPISMASDADSAHSNIDALGVASPPDSTAKSPECLQDDLSEDEDDFEDVEDLHTPAEEPICMPVLSKEDQMEVQSTKCTDDSSSFHNNLRVSPCKIVPVKEIMTNSIEEEGFSVASRDSVEELLAESTPNQVPIIEPDEGRDDMEKRLPNPEIMDPVATVLHDLASSLSSPESPKENEENAPEETVLTDSFSPQSLKTTENPHIAEESEEDKNNTDDPQCLDKDEKSKQNPRILDPDQPLDPVSVLQEPASPEHLPEFPKLNENPLKIKEKWPGCEEPNIDESYSPHSPEMTEEPEEPSPILVTEQPLAPKDILDHDNSILQEPASTVHLPVPPEAKENSSICGDKKPEEQCVIDDSYSPQSPEMTEEPELIVPTIVYIEQPSPQKNVSEDEPASPRIPEENTIKPNSSKKRRSHRKALIQSLFWEDDEPPTSPQPIDGSLSLDRCDELSFSGQSCEVNDSDLEAEMEMALQEVINLPGFIQPLPLTPKIPVLRNLKRKKRPASPVPEKTVKLMDEFDLEIEYLDTLISNPISPLPPSDDEEEGQIADEIKEKPNLASNYIRSFKKKVKPGSYILAGDIYKQNMRCLAVNDDDTFCTEKFDRISETVNSLSQKVFLEILARSLVLAVLDGRHGLLLTDRKPFALTCAERRVIFLAKRLEESSFRWSKLSTAMIKESMTLLLAPSLPKFPFQCRPDEALFSALTRLIAALSMLINESGYAKGLIQLGCLYVPYRIASIGSALVTSWHSMLDPNNLEDAKLLDALYHSCSQTVQKKKMLELLRKYYGVTFNPSKTFDIARFYGTFPLKLMQSSNADDVDGSTHVFSGC